MDDCELPRSRDRAALLRALRGRKMARSAQAYVRGSTLKFYEWLASQRKHSLPEGPPVWICGDCHAGNLGPLANAEGEVEIQIRDMDQTVIGNPAHDLIRLALLSTPPGNIARPHHRTRRFSPDLSGPRGELSCTAVL
jgi:uncharacterized protein (DUF2252 family)